MQDEFDVLPSGEAQALLDSEMLTDILSTLEKDAIEACVNAKPSDDETRRTNTNKVRAIRDLREQLIALAKGKAKQSQVRQKA